MSRSPLDVSPLLSPDVIIAFQQKLLHRYTENKRDLPRRETTDPYQIMVSEIMSQQTQVARVIPKYHAFLEKRPTAYDLSQADTKTVLTYWSWLGYNNRALRLREAARVIVSDYDGHMPRDESALLALPWIGPYTAHAIMAFAFNIDVPVLDINIKRVLIHEFWLPIEISDSALRNIAITVVPAWQSRDRHNALMDYGSLVHTSKKTWVKSAKQSTFIGSRRRVRWSLLKHLIKHDSVSIKKAEDLFPHAEFTDIISQMVRDKLIVIDQETWTITTTTD